MKIENVKISGIKNPVGYAMETPVVSWCVTECLGGYQTSVRIDVSPNEDFSEIIFTKSGSDLPCSGTKLEFKPEPRTRYYLCVTVESDRNTAASEMCIRDRSFTGPLRRLLTISGHRILKLR